jgi:dual specificity protein kinase YAK1
MGRPGQFDNTPGSFPSQLNTKFNGQHHPPQAQPPAGYTYESYQTPITASKAATLSTNSKSVAMTSSPSATPQNRDYVTDADTPMEDADPYNRSKYPTRLTHQTRPSSQYLPNEESTAARRYSPMNILSPTLPFSSSPTKNQIPYAGPPQGSSSSRQSPTRASAYSSPTQAYQSPPGKYSNLAVLYFSFRQRLSDNLAITTGSRGSRLPPIDLSPELYFPTSATSLVNSPFGPDAKSPRPAQHNDQNQTPGRGPIPKLFKIASTQELRPRMNTQPPYRRANPEGGFISVSRATSKK